MIISRKHNEYSRVAENEAPLARRLFIYQRERFPLLGHGLLVVAFSFSAVSYSRICRGAAGFVDWKTFAVGIFTTVSLFFLVRVFDEFKDATDDERFRRELAVPRGLVSLKELATTATVLAALLVLLNLYFFPRMLVILGVIVFYLLMMGKEFFVSEWLKKHQFWYVISHMFIIPLIDVYASGLDWLLVGVAAPMGLLFFFAVSYMNGIVLEIGRKITVPTMEKEGVLTYSARLSANRATWLWLATLTVTLSLSVLAAIFAGHGQISFIILSVIFGFCGLQAVFFLIKKTAKAAKMIEYASAFWTIGMYLTLGGGPMLTKLLTSA